jgi:hypothetical protein
MASRCTRQVVGTIVNAQIFDKCRTRGEQVARLRKRLKAIKPEDRDMIALVGAVKGLLDIVADDGDDFE